jgi:hypothetical protein
VSAEEGNLDGTEPTAAQNEARALAAQAGETWMRSFEGYEDSIVTGYVLILETTQIGQHPYVTWLSGNGVVPEGDHLEGLATHRVLGLVETCRDDMHARRVAQTIGRIQDDE